ncbi:hypothetical protein J1N35_045339 [Gossypium stocksii]|uniref:MADS-box domain-containing protein n=1 Tax=Gossypium stocksii TaxID=47602 RepID=A0A9D3UB24_9ROSI|nr:hypothetical protein J1N35_045339 [Gossypium stocksii]
MSRKKMKLAYITNDSKRKTTYKKRTKGLVKKVREFTTLCGIEACATIHSLDFNSQPKLWLSHTGVRRLLSEFKKLPQSK